MNWTQLLQQAGIPDPPGFAATCELIASEKAQQAEAQAAAATAQKASVPAKRRSRASRRR